MKKILISCFFIITIGNISYGQSDKDSSVQSLDWQPNFELAQNKSKIDNKKMLIYFTGSDWCGPCKMLDVDFFESDEFKVIATKEFILYKADSPRNVDLVTATQKKDNRILKSKFNIFSYPTIVLIDSNGKLLNKMKGYNLMRDTSFHFDFIHSVLK